MRGSRYLFSAYSLALRISQASAKPQAENCGRYFTADTLMTFDCVTPVLERMRIVCSSV